MKLTPLTMRIVKQNAWDEWEIWQKFDRLGTTRTVYGWGVTRLEALQDFDRCKARMENDQDIDPLKPLLDFLWNVAGLIDKIWRKR